MNAIENIVMWMLVLFLYLPSNGQPGDCLLSDLIDRENYAVVKVGKLQLAEGESQTEAFYAVPGNRYKLLAVNMDQRARDTKLGFCKAGGTTVIYEQKENRIAVIYCEPAKPGFYTLYIHNTDSVISTGKDTVWYLILKKK